MVLLDDCVFLRPGLPEYRDEEKADRKYNHCGGEADEHLMQGEGEGADLQRGDRAGRLLRLEPHGVRDHRQKEQGEAAGYSLTASELTARGSGED